MVEGMANPNAFFYYLFNDPLYIGCFSFFAMNTRIVAVENSAAYQYTIGTINAQDRYSFSESPHFDFSFLRELETIYRNDFFSVQGELDVFKANQLRILLDEIFSENVNLLKEALIYHLKAKPNAPIHNYAAPILTRYGRLVHHESSDAPMVESNFSLLHYQKAILEFNDIKSANIANRLDDAIMHGAYTIIALGATIESIGNKLYYIANSKNRSEKDTGKAIDIMHESAITIRNTNLIEGKKVIFEKLKKTSSEYEAIEKVRSIRNDLMHFIEQPFYIDTETHISKEYLDLSEDSCRRLLHDVREGLLFILRQIPEIGNPIVLDKRVTWQGDKEVP
jgi:hypothetical protein